MTRSWRWTLPVVVLALGMGLGLTAGEGDAQQKNVVVAQKDGVRTSVFWLKLATGSEYDVQFDDLKKEYVFGVAVFDNAQVRHAYTPGVLKLKFE